MEVNDVNQVLIRLVKQHPNLYDKSLTSYRDNEKKDRSWASITIDFNNSTGYKAEVAQVISQWKELKSCYMNYVAELKKYIPSGSGQQQQKDQWIYYTEMGFLEDQVEHRRTISTHPFGKENTQVNRVTETPMRDDVMSGAEGGAGNIFQNFLISSHSSSQQNFEKLSQTYIDILWDAWCKIPPTKRKNCYFDMEHLIISKKNEE
ncbi:uncharacterized protein LOC127278476 [Leptopilina boulardi]|uniref:uncharacterized protein LOC127278476 n=1 Tax=Leptopilina boulardi TaxID=63433 RepID=UPI0021F513A6|nr:uncharacterized protein LOC127278476 [Leptopilina boulardi]